jgi:alcohol dehydrogenase class IV
MMAHYFYMPAVNITGRGRLAAACKEIQAMGLRKSLVVTDAPLHRGVGANKPLLAMFEAINVPYTVYTGSLVGWA